MSATRQPMYVQHGMVLMIIITRTYEGLTRNQIDLEKGACIYVT